MTNKESCTIYQGGFAQILKDIQNNLPLQMFYFIQSFDILSYRLSQQLCDGGEAVIINSQCLNSARSSDLT